MSVRSDTPMDHAESPKNESPKKKVKIFPIEDESPRLNAGESDVDIKAALSIQEKQGQGAHTSIQQTLRLALSGGRAADPEELSHEALVGSRKLSIHGFLGTLESQALYRNIAYIQRRDVAKELDLSSVSLSDLSINLARSITEKGLNIVEKTEHIRLCCSSSSSLPPGALAKFKEFERGLQLLELDRFWTHGRMFVNFVIRNQAEDSEKGPSWRDMPLWVYGLETRANQMLDRVAPPVVMASSIEEGLIGVMALVLGKRQMMSYACIFPVFAIGGYQHALDLCKNEIEMKKKSMQEHMVPSVMVKQQNLSTEARDCLWLINSENIMRLLCPASVGFDLDPHLNLELSTSLVRYLLDSFGVPDPRKPFQELYPYKRLFDFLSKRVTNSQNLEGEGGGRAFYFASELFDMFYEEVGTPLHTVYRDWQDAVLTKPLPRVYHKKETTLSLRLLEDAAPAMTKKERDQLEVEKKEKAAIRRGFRNIQQSSAHMFDQAVVASEELGRDIQRNVIIAKKSSRQLIKKLAKSDTSQQSETSVIGRKQIVLNTALVSSHTNATGKRASLMNPLSAAKLLGPARHGAWSTAKRKTLTMVRLKGFSEQHLSISLKEPEGGEHAATADEPSPMSGSGTDSKRESVDPAASPRGSHGEDANSVRTIMPSPIDTLLWSLYWWYDNERKSLIRSAFLIKVTSAWGAAEAILTTQIFSKAQTQQMSDSESSVHSNSSHGLFFLMTTYVLGGFFAACLHCPAGAMFTPSIKTHMLKHISQMPQHALEKIEENQLFRLFEIDIVLLDRSLVYIQLMASQLLKSTTAVITMFVLSPGLAGLILLSLPPGLYAIEKLGKRIVPTLDRVNEERHDLTTYAQEFFLVCRVMRCLMLHEVVYDELRMHAQQLKEAYEFNDIHMANQIQVTHSFSIMMKAIVLMYGAMYISGLYDVSSISQGSDNDIPTFIGMMVALDMLLGVLLGKDNVGLSDMWRHFSIAAVSLGNVLQILRITPDVFQRLECGEFFSDDQLLIPHEKEVAMRLQGLTYFYLGKDTPTINNINVDIPAGKKLAVMGRSGSGKTTLIRLLCRLLQPATGSIYVGGIPLNCIKLSKYKPLGQSLEDGVKEAPVTVLTTTFNLAFAEKLDLIGMLVEGKLAELGVKHDLMQLKGHFWQMSSKQEGLTVVNGKAAISESKLLSMWPFAGARTLVALRPVVSVFENVHVKEGKTVVQENDEMNGYYILVSGYIELRQNGVKTEVLAVGSTFGEEALFEASRLWAFTGIARSNCLLLFVEHQNGAHELTVDWIKPFETVDTYSLGTVFQNLLCAIPTLQDSLMTTYRTISQLIGTKQLQQMWPFIGVAVARHGRRGGEAWTVATIQQEVILFNATVWENITMGLEHEEIAEDRIMNLCEQFQLLQDPYILEVGLHTPVGVNGATMGPEIRQRIGIVRAAARNTPVLLMDEPLAVQEPKMAETIFDVIRTLKEDEDDQFLHIKSTLTAGKYFGALGPMHMDGAVPNGAFEDRILQARVKTRGMVAELTPETFQNISLNRLSQDAHLMIESNFACYMNLISGSLLSTHWLFSQLQDTELAELATQFDVVTLDDEELLFSKRDGLNLDNVYIVISGCISLITFSQEDDMNLMFFAGTGACLNDKDLITKHMQASDETGKQAGPMSPPEIAGTLQGEGSAASRPGGDLPCLASLDMRIHPACFPLVKVGNAGRGHPRSGRKSIMTDMHSSPDLRARATLLSDLGHEDAAELLSPLLQRMQSGATSETYSGVGLEVEYATSSGKAIIGVASHKKVSKFLTRAMVSQTRQAVRHIAQEVESICTTRMPQLLRKFGLGHLPKRNQSLMCKLADIRQGRSVVEADRDILAEPSSSMKTMTHEEQVGVEVPDIKMDSFEEIKCEANLELIQELVAEQSYSAESEEEQFIGLVLHGEVIVPPDPGAESAKLIPHTKDHLLGAALDVREADGEIEGEMSEMEPGPMAGDAGDDEGDEDIENEEELMHLSEILSLKEEMGRNKQYRIELVLKTSEALKAERSVLLQELRSTKRELGLIPKFNARERWWEARRLCKDYIRLSNYQNQLNLYDMVQKLIHTEVGYGQDKAKVDPLQQDVVFLKNETRKHSELKAERKLEADAIIKRVQGLGWLEGIDSHNLQEEVKGLEHNLSLSRQKKMLAMISEVWTRRRHHLLNLSTELQELWKFFGQEEDFTWMRDELADLSAKEMLYEKDFSTVEGFIRDLRDRMAPEINFWYQACLKAKQELEAKGGEQPLSVKRKEEQLFEACLGPPNETLLSKLKQHHEQLEFAVSLAKSMKNLNDSQAQIRETEGWLRCRNHVKLKLQKETQHMKRMLLHPVSPTSRPNTPAVDLRAVNTAGEKKLLRKGHAFITPDVVPISPTLDNVMFRNAVQVMGATSWPISRPLPAVVLVLNVCLPLKGQQLQKRTLIIENIKRRQMMELGSDPGDADALMRTWGTGIGDEVLWNCEKGLKNLQGRVTMERLKCRELATECRLIWHSLSHDVRDQENRLEELMVPQRLDLQRKNLEEELAVLRDGVRLRDSRQLRAVTLIQVCFRGLKTRTRLMLIGRHTARVRELQTMLEMDEEEGEKEHMTGIAEMDVGIRCLEKRVEYLQRVLLMRNTQRMSARWQKMKVSEEEQNAALSSVAAMESTNAAIEELSSQGLGAGHCK
eukprot:gene3639-4576_t